MDHNAAAPQQFGRPLASAESMKSGDSFAAPAGSPWLGTGAECLGGLEAVGAAFLALYEATCQLPLVKFQAFAMEKLRAALPFDCAWWGLASQVNGQLHVHFSYQHDLPENLSEIINATGGDNVVARSCASKVGTTFNFSPADLYADVATGLPAQVMGIQHLLCTQVLGGPSRTWSVLALMRRDRSSPFSEGERRLKERLMPHLAQMLSINRCMYMAFLRSKAKISPGFAGILNEHDMIHTYDPGFDAMLRLEWPNWDGILLPQPVITARRRGSSYYLGKNIAVQFDLADEQDVVVVNRRSKLNLLSPREQVIAKSFAEGSSYKEVARTLGISPATVRNHLGKIYEKLEIGSKVELSRLYAGRAVDALDVGE